MRFRGPASLSRRTRAGANQFHLPRLQPVRAEGHSPDADCIRRDQVQQGSEIADIVLASIPSSALRESAASGVLRRLLSASPRAYGTTHREQRSEEHTSELQSRQYIVCRLLLAKK